MNILFVSDEWDPRETTDGGKQRTHLLWLSLCELGSVYTLVLSGKEKYKSSDQVKYLSDCEECNEKCMLFNKVAKYFDYVLQWKTGFSFFSKDCRCDVERIYPGIHFDVVVYRYFKTVLHFQVYGLAPIYVDIDDYPVVRFDTVLCKQRKLNCIGQLFWRNILKLELWWHSLHWAGCWVADENDLKKVGTSKNAVFLKNIPFQLYPIVEPTKKRTAIFMVGGATHLPNRYGVSAFLKDIWPKVYQKYPWLHFWIIGANWKECLGTELGDLPNVEFCGFVSDIAEIYANSLASVVPIDSGGGHVSRC